MAGTMPGGMAAIMPVSAAVERAVLPKLVERLAATAGVSSNLVKAVITVESSWKHTAVSPAGAMGLMQLMPATAARLAVTDPFDTEQNIRGGATELRRLLNRYGNNAALALAAYNAGETVVNRCGCVPNNGETAEYVARVLRFLEQAGGL